MAHYAKVRDGIVINVIVAEPDYFDNLVETEAGEWIQTSYNTHRGIHYTETFNEEIVESEDQTKALRKNFAGIGYTYDSERDAFIPPTPHASWVLNEEGCFWEAPVAYPDDGQNYIWNEGITNWTLVD